MKPFTIMLADDDIIKIKKIASRLCIPPHVLARSILVRGMRDEITNWKLESLVASKNDEVY